MNRNFLLSLCAALLPLTFSARADEASEAKAREQLKAVTMQLRTLQTEKSAAMAVQADLEAKNKALDAQVKQQGKRIEELDKELKTTREAAQKKQEEQSASIAHLEGEVTRFKAALDKWQAAHATINDIAKKKEAERAKLAAKSADLERKVADLRAKNSELYKLAMEILTRYQQFGLGQSLAAREPFTGNAKVKLQNIVQDYGDKILNQTAKP